jgi:hypothetical protein
MYTPHPFFERPLLPPIAPPAPLPALTKTPARLTSETIAPDLVTVTESIDPLGQLWRAVRAEDERMRRILPPAPDGYAWEGELQTQEPALDFERGRGTIEARIVYRLVEREATL